MHLIKTQIALLVSALLYLSADGESQPITRHGYSYNADGLVVVDTLYERDEIGYVATMVTKYHYNTEDEIVETAQWRQFSGEWYRLEGKTDKTGNVTVSACDSSMKQ